MFGYFLCNSKELLSTGFSDIIVPIYNLSKYMHENFNSCFTSTFALTTTVRDFAELLKSRNYPQSTLLRANKRNARHVQ